MSSMTLTGRRAAVFADLVDRDRPTDDPVVGPLVALAQSLQAVPAVDGPRPEFRAALRQRLVAVAAVQGAGAPDASVAARLREAGSTWRFQRRVAALAGGAAAVTAIAGVGIGASRALPGDPFYGVKRATEDVQLATTFGKEAKGKRHLEFARTRLSEVEALSGHSSALGGFVPGTAGAVGPLSDEAKSSTLIDTLHDMDDETRAGVSDLFAVARDTGSREPLSAVDSFTREQFADLTDLLPALPSEVQAEATDSLRLLKTVSDQTYRLAGLSTDAGPGTTPGEPSATTTPEATRTPDAGKTGTPAPGETTATPDAGSTTSPPATEPLPTLPEEPLPTKAPTIPPILPTTDPLSGVTPTEIPTLPDLPILGS